jgi:uncharacterized membrane protein
VALLLKLISAAALGALDLWAGIPVGLALGLSLVVSGIAATSGGLVGAVLVTVAGERLQRWLYSRGWLSKRRKRIERMWERYGILGVAFQAPMLTGAPLGTLVALGLGAPAKRLLFWMCISLVLWGAVLTGVAALGFSIFGV